MKHKISLALVSAMFMALEALGVTFDCEEPIDDSTQTISATAKEFQLYFSPVNTCFDQTKSYSAEVIPQYGITILHDNYDDPHNIKKGFEEQKAFCDCLNSMPGQPSVGSSIFDREIDSVNHEALAFAHLRKLITTFGKRTNYTQNMMILQAQTMGKDTAHDYNLHNPAKINQNYEASVGSMVKKNVKKDLISSSAKEFDNKVDNYIKEVTGRNSGKSVIEALTGKEVKGEACYPMKEFLAINSFPQSSNFWASIGDSKPSDWNIDLLVDKFKTTSNVKERDEVADRITFLEKNPFIKLVFRSGNAEASNKILDVMRRNMGNLSKDCVNRGYAGCHREFVNKKIHNYTQELAKVFQEPKMKKLIEDQRNLELEKQLDDLIEGSAKDTDLTTLDYYAEAEHGISFSGCKTNKQILETSNTLFTPYSSFGEFTAAEKENNKKELLSFCDRKLPAYCKAVGKGPTSILSIGSVKQWSERTKNNIDQLFENIALSASPNPAENFEYQKYAEDQCENIYRFYNGQSVNMVNFTHEYCKTKKPECSDKMKLFDKFQSLKFDLERTKDNPWLSEFDPEPYRITSVVQNISEDHQSTFKKAQEELFSIFNPQNRDVNKSSSGNVDYVLTNVESSISDTSSNISSVRIPNIATNNIQTILPINSVREMKNEVDEEIAATKQAIEYNKERLARPNTTPQFKDEVGERLKSLEALLAEKEKSAQEYQSIITKLLEQKKSASSDEDEFVDGANPKKIMDQELTGNTKTIASSKPVISNLKSNETPDELTRGPASISENFSTAGGIQGGHASIGSGTSSLSNGALGSRKGAINSALLSKYGITVQETDANIAVAQDKDKSQISQLLTNASKSDLGLQVSQSEFDKFKNNDINALNQLYREKIESLGTDVVKLLIHTEGEKDALEFYAIKEGGKVVFQPVRKNKLSDLQNVLR